MILLFLHPRVKDAGYEDCVNAAEGGEAVKGFLVCCEGHGRGLCTLWVSGRDATRG